MFMHRGFRRSVASARARAVATAFGGRGGCRAPFATPATSPGEDGDRASAAKARGLYVYRVPRPHRVCWLALNCRLSCRPWPRLMISRCRRRYDWLMPSGQRRRAAEEMCFATLWACSLDAPNAGRAPSASSFDIARNTPSGNTSQSAGRRVR
ncbi:hypothetical protein PYCCODRAFT_747789 [Trametes coccinea BRFM310]|uniref:Uncharacterized protein n=1 Tax=Trametes coccinea (strain BRFM310) TaxID=1353009 RepID=A0A1Y2IHL6_TRAC3|nr:hypothetical protein PYCCODRAFT_747789 [Trametes coccinea BRFM310]